MARIYESESSFLSVNLTKFDPDRRNRCEEFSANLHLMVDSGDMCSLLNYDAVRAMGPDPEKLEKSNLSITGVNGKKLKSQTRQMCVMIINNKTGTESWKKLYVSPEVKTSLLSKDLEVFSLRKMAQFDVLAPGVQQH